MWQSHHGGADGLGKASGAALGMNAHGALRVLLPMTLFFSPQTVQPGHHHQNLLGRKVGSAPAPWQSGRSVPGSHPPFLFQG